MKTSLPLVLALALPVLGSCDCGTDPQQQASSGETQTPQAGIDSPSSTEQERTFSPDPFGLGVVSRKPLVTELPKEPFFAEYRYPGSKVVDVTAAFGTRAVKLTSTDEFEKVDAFYKKKFTTPEGEVQGRSGRYLRLTENGPTERVSISKRVGGGCEIIMGM